MENNNGVGDGEQSVCLSCGLSPPVSTEQKPNEVSPEPEVLVSEVEPSSALKENTAELLEENTVEKIIVEKSVAEESIPEESIPEESVAEESVAKESIPEESIPEESIPEESIAEESIATASIAIAEESVAKQSVAKKSIAEEIIAKESIAEESILEEIITKESIAEESIATASIAIAEESVAKQSVAKKSIAEEIIAKESIPEESVAEESVAEESVAKESIPEESVAEESVAEESVAKESIPEESVAEESVAKESIPEERVAEDSTVEKNAAEENTTEESTVVLLQETGQEKLTEELVAPPLKKNNGGIEIRLVLADCLCGRPKLSLENEVVERVLTVSEPDEQSTHLGSEKEAAATEDRAIIDDSVDLPNDEDQTNDESIEKLESESVRLEPSDIVEISEDDTSDEHDLNVCQFWGKNWRQFTSVLPGLLLLLTIGAHNNYEVIHLHCKALHFDGFAAISVLFVWFGGSIIGNVFGAFFVQNMKKRTIYYLAALLHIIGGLLFYVLRREQMIIFNHSPFTISLAARFVSGVVSGLVYLTVTVHASDIGSKRMRRVISYSIVLIISLSTLFYSVFQAHSYTPRQVLVEDVVSFDFNMIAMGVLVLLLTPLLTNETVPYYLLRGKVAKAQKKFVKLNSERESEPSAETLSKFDELQVMVREDTENGINIFGGGNFKPLFTVLCARLLHISFTNVLSVDIVKRIPSKRGLTIPYRSIDGSFFVELSAIRVGVGIIAIALAGCCGRHKFFYIGPLFVALVATGLTTVSATWEAFPVPKWLVSLLVFGTYTIFSLGLDYYQQKQSADAFPVTKKAWSLAVIGFFEHACQIAALHASMMGNPIVTLSIIASIIVLPIVLLSIVPETRKLSLRETRNKFNKMFAKIVNSAV